MRIPRALLPHRVIVELLEGSGPYGDKYADPQTLEHAAVDDKRRVVRDGNGNEVVAETTVIVEPHHDITPGSRVTVWPGTPHERAGNVITVSRLTFPGTPSHLELALT